MHNPHDQFFRAVFSQPENAAAHFRQYLPSDLVDRLDLGRAALQSGAMVPPLMRERYADLLYRVPLTEPAEPEGPSEAYVCVLFEHQSSVDPMMPLRLLLYMAAVWDRVWETHERRVIRLPAIVPIVLYHGDRRWKAARDFQGLIALPPEILACVVDYLPRFTFALNDLKRTDDADVQFHPILGLVLKALKHSRDPDFKARLPELTSAVVAALEQGDRGLSAFVLFMQYVLEQRGDVGPEDFTPFVETEVRPDLKEIVMSTAERLRNEGRVKGREEGRQEGIEIGALAAMRRILLRLIQLRLGPPTREVQDRIAVATEPELARWTERVIDAATIDELFAA
ncbi:MAG: Rpn family recombination-promoting nuclease/putative transposase [Myxococcota bacterium]